MGKMSKEEYEVQEVKRVSVDQRLLNALGMMVGNARVSLEEGKTIQGWQQINNAEAILAKLWETHE